VGARHARGGRAGPRCHPGLHGEIWTSNNWVVRQGTWLTMGLWVLSLALHFVSGAGGAQRRAGNLEASSFLLYLAVTYGVQNYVVHRRAVPLWDALGPRSGAAGCRSTSTRGRGAPGAFFATFRGGGPGFGPGFRTPRVSPARSRSDDPTIIDAEVVDDDDGPARAALSRTCRRGASSRSLTLGPHVDPPAVQSSAVPGTSRFHRVAPGAPRRLGRRRRGRGLRAARRPRQSPAVRHRAGAGRTGGSPAGALENSMRSTSPPAAHRRDGGPADPATGLSRSSNPICARCASVSGKAACSARRWPTPIRWRCGC
jgi:hypothetical protein